MVPGLRQHFLDALTALASGVDVAAVEAALAAGDTPAVLAAVPLEQFVAALEAALPTLEAVSAAAHQVSLARTGQPMIDFGQVSDPVIAAIRQDAAQLVADVDDETRAAIRQSVERAYRAGRGTRTAAEEIADVVGLTRQQEASIAAQRGTVADADLSEQADAMREQRAATIARTETNAAMNRGNRAAWRDLAHRGLLDASAWRREWLTVLPASGVCPICAPLDRGTAPLHGVYSDGTDGPPAHPNCRCTEVLVPARE